MQQHPGEQPAGGHSPSRHEHQRLFEQLDQVAHRLRGAPAELEQEMQELERLVREHCAREERSLFEQGYPGLRAHREEHAAYLRELERARRDGLGPAGLAFLRAWLVNHQAESERQHQEWLAEAARTSGIGPRGDPAAGAVVLDGRGGREASSR